MITQDYFIVATLAVNLYLCWRNSVIEHELDKLTKFCFKSINMLAEAVDEIEEYLDDQQQQQYKDNQHPSGGHARGDRR